MYTTDILHSLIKTMSKSEKRYFRMVAQLQKGEKDYVVLFDELDRHPVFDDTAAFQVKSRLPAHTMETARKHLYRVLMKSLRHFESEKDLDIKLVNLMHDSRILHNKGLIGLSIGQLRVVMDLAMKHERFLYFVQAARLELQYLARNRFSEISEFDLIDKQKKITQLLEHESKISSHAMLYEVLVLRYWQNGIARIQSDITQLNDLLLQEYYLLNDPGYKSFESTRVHLQFQSIYLQMTGNTAGSLDVFYELNDLFEKHEELWQDSPLHYLQVLDGILYDLRSMERFKDMDFFLEKLEKLQGRPGMQSLVPGRVLQHRLDLLADQNQRDQAMVLLRATHHFLTKELPLLPTQSGAALAFACVRVYVINREFSVALRLINDMLNRPRGTISQSLQVLFELMNLQVNAALRNSDYLVYAIRALQRKLRNERKLHGVENFLLWFLKTWLAFKPVTTWRERLNSLNDNPYEKQLIRELCLHEWCELIASRKF